MVLFRRHRQPSSSRSTSLSGDTELSDQSDSDNDSLKGPIGLNLLYSGSNPLVDLVFVHGLGGGSRRTWTKFDDPANFWPKEWLSRDADFGQTRVQSFGYEADWRRRGSVLDIHDFARSLVSAVQNSPDIRKSKTKIVFIGHSMGGIVIKKAYMLAQQDPMLRDVAARIHSIYFLGTPHRGSDLAGTLNNILSFTYGQKMFVQEIERNSTSVEAINDTFRHYSGSVQLHSFYETRPLGKFGLQAMIVEKDSAVLGFPNEQSVPMSADHRGVCKFSSVTDVDYIALRNALSSTVDSIISEGMSHEESALSIGRLRTFLAVSDESSDDLATLDNNRVVGSCQWFVESKIFTSWKSQESQSANPVLWLSGNAASGKSTICSYAINFLQAQGIPCFFFFFKQARASKSSTADCIRSIAYQAACHNESVRSKILAMESQNLTPDREDDRTLWRRLIQDSLFSESPPEMQYWVVDALDECRNPQVFLRLISELPTNFRILISSRQTRDIENGLIDLRSSILHQQLRPMDTETDIRLFISSSIDRLPVSYDDRLDLTNEIMAKASGSFLWVRLVMQELENAYSKESISTVLSEIPPGMNELYDRMLQRIAVNRGKNLAQSILTWVIFSSRALSVEELQAAVKLDINETLSNPEKSITSICDQFITLDQCSRVHLIHETAREYLLNQRLVPELSIQKRGGHTRLANACLKTLSGDCFSQQRREQRRPSYAQRLKSMDRLKNSKRDLLSSEAALMGYACSHFSDHISKASLDHALLDLLCSFLNENSLPWIEHMAVKRDLSVLVRTGAINLKMFLDRHARHLPPIDWRVSTIDAWSTDLVRVAAKFRSHLLAFPSCIHSLIPAFCPSQSIISKSRASRNQSFVIAGLDSKDWDDCITRIDFQGAKPSSIVCGESLFAIGLSNGEIHSYSDDSLQKRHQVIDHGERVKTLVYSTGDQHLLSAGIRTVRLWNTESSSLVWSYHCTRQPLAVCFMENDEFVNIALQSNLIVTVRAVDGAEVGKINLLEHISITAECRSYAPPSLMEFSIDSNLLAVACRGQPVCLFDINDEKFHLECRRDTGPGSTPAVHYSVDAMVFNPNPNIPVLVVSFGDGELVIFNSWSGASACKVPGAYAHNLACAPDGRCLITASAQGCIQIYDFGGISGDQLSLSYQIDASDPDIRGLAFASNNLRFLDIRSSSQCRVWEPDFLVRRIDSEGSSQSDLTHSIPTRVRHKGVLEVSGDPDISAIYCHTNGQTISIFCGTQTGTIYSYDNADATRTCTIFESVSNIAVAALATLSVDETTLISADEAGCLSFRQISEAPGGCWTLKKSIEARTDETIARLLVDASRARVLVIGTQTLSLWSPSGEQLWRRLFPSPETVLPHPTRPELFIALAHGSVSILNWADLGDYSASENTPYHSSSGVVFAAPPFQSFICSPSFVVALRKDPVQPKSLCLEYWPSSALEPDTEPQPPWPCPDGVGLRVVQLVSFIGSSTLLFLDSDLWLCSVELKAGATGLASTMVRRHFFVLSEWRGATGKVPLTFCEATKEFVVTVGSRIVVIKGGLDIIDYESGYLGV